MFQGRAATRLGFLAHAEVIWGVLDGDEAGRLAAERFAELLAGRFRPLTIADGSDLNDLGLADDGRRTFLAVLAKETSVDRQARGCEPHRFLSESYRPIVFPSENASACWIDSGWHLLNLSSPVQIQG